MEKEQLIALVKKSQSGDAEAIEKLLLYAHTSVSYQCRKMLGNEQDAEDMTQEVLVTIYTKLDTLQEPAAFHKWANQITTSRCINALNRTHVEYQFAEDEEGHSILDTLEELDEQMIPDKAIDNAETVRMIEEIVDGLPDVQRAATLMFYYNEMSVKEIAQAMRVSENTVKSRLNYARKAIKEKVLDYEKQGVKLYGLSPLPFLLYFLRLAAQNSADKKAAGVVVAKVMAAEGAAVTIAAGAGTAAAAAGASVVAGSAATAAGSTAAAGIFAGISAKVVAGVLAAVVTVGSIVAVVIPNTQTDPTDPTAISAEDETDREAETSATESVESESLVPTEQPTVPVETEEPTEESTEVPAVETQPTEEIKPAETEPMGTESPTVPTESTDTSTDSTGNTCTSCGIGSFSMVDLNTDPCAYRGYVAYQCNHCGYVAGYGYPVLEGHKMVDGVCSVCGYTQEQCEHFYDSGVENWPAGQMTWEPYILYTCQFCGHTYTEPIDYLP